MDKIKVSVIVPVYNGSKYISTSLYSIINQNFKDFELIIINDGSTDDSLDIISEILSNEDINYQIITQENKGASNARNHGLKLAKGDYILFVDVDDYIEKNHIKYLYNELCDNNTDFSFSKLLKIDLNKKILTDENQYNKLENKNVLSTLELIKMDLEMKIPFSFSQILYKTSILKENNLYFNENYVYGEDTDFALRALFCGENVSIVEKPTYFYLQHENSATSNLYLNRFEIIKIFENLSFYFKGTDKCDYSEEIKDLLMLIKYNRIPKAIFGNLMYFFYRGYDLNEILDEMEKLDLFSKLSRFKIRSLKDILFLLKSKVFLINPKIYYKIWKKLKNSI